MFHREVYNLLLDLTVQENGNRERIAQILEENMNAAFRVYRETQSSPAPSRPSKRANDDDVECPNAPKKRRAATINDACIWIKKEYNESEEKRELLVNELIRYLITNDIPFYQPFEKLQEWVSKPAIRTIFLESESEIARELYHVLINVL